MVKEEDMVLSQAHHDLLLTHYSSIGEAIVDVHTYSQHSKAYELLQNEYPKKETLLNTLYEKLKNIANHLLEKAINYKRILDLKIEPEFIVEFRDLLSKISKSGKRIGAYLKDAFFDSISRIIEVFKSIFGDSVTNLIIEVNSLKNTIYTYAVRFIKTLALGIYSVVDYIYKGFAKLATVIFNAFTGIVNGIVKIGKDTTSYVYDRAVRTITYIMSLINETLIAAKEVEQRSKKFIESMSRRVTEKIIEIIRDVPSLQLTALGIKSIIETPYVQTAFETLSMVALDINWSSILYLVAQSGLLLKTFKYMSESLYFIMPNFIKGAFSSITTLFYDYMNIDVNDVSLKDSTELLEKIDPQDPVLKKGDELKQKIASVAKYKTGNLSTNLSKIHQIALLNSRVYSNVFLGIENESKDMDQFTLENVGLDFEEYMSYTQYLNPYMQNTIMSKTFGQNQNVEQVKFTLIQEFKNKQKQYIQSLITVEQSIKENDERIIKLIQEEFGWESESSELDTLEKIRTKLRSKILTPYEFKIQLRLLKSDITKKRYLTIFVTVILGVVALLFVYLKKEFFINSQELINQQFNTLKDVIILEGIPSEFLKTAKQFQNKYGVYTTNNLDRYIDGLFNTYNWTNVKDSQNLIETAKEKLKTTLRASPLVQSDESYFFKILSLQPTVESYAKWATGYEVKDTRNVETNWVTEQPAYIISKNLMERGVNYWNLGEDTAVAAFSFMITFKIWAIIISFVGLVISSIVIYFISYKYDVNGTELILKHGSLWVTLSLLPLSYDIYQYGLQLYKTLSAITYQKNIFLLSVVGGTLSALGLGVLKSSVDIAMSQRTSQFQLETHFIDMLSGNRPIEAFKEDMDTYTRETSESFEKLIELAKTKDTTKSTRKEETNKMKLEFNKSKLLN